MNQKLRPCRELIKPTAEDVNFCRALLNGQCSSFEFPKDLKERRKLVCRLPPVDFVYGLKTPKSNGIAETLRHDETPKSSCRNSKNPIPDFLSLNRLFPRLKLTKVNEIHQFRKTQPIHLCKSLPRKCKEMDKNVTFGRITEKQTSIRDLLEHKYLRQWLEETARHRCKKLLEQQCESPKKKLNVKRNSKRVFCH